MAKVKEFRVLVATDGSAQARTAIAAAVRFPWPAGTRLSVVVARSRVEYGHSILLSALDRSADLASAGARRALAPRWPDAEVVVVNKAPVAGILGEAARLGADVIVLGWRGHGAVRRFLMGSVSRGVVRGTACPVLVVRRRAVSLRKIVIGLDGSPASLRAVTLVSKLIPPSDGRVTLVSAVTPMSVRSQGLASSAIRATVAQEVKRRNAAQSREAMKALNRAAAELGRSGWRTRTVLTAGAPLRDLLATARSERAQLVVVGARGTSGLRHLLLGSVAEGALNRSSASVLVVR